MPSTKVSRAEQVTRELVVLTSELGKIDRATIVDRQAVLAAIHDLHSAAMRWLADAQN
jgi:Glu-tRNA(Gln) amidotransferase subunit E-like FAD-binding protein